MAAAKPEFRPQVHGEIEKLSETLWRVQGPVPGSPLSRVMTVVRLNDGRLIIHNGIAMNPESMAELETWGQPTFLIVPGAYHRMDALVYSARYPNLATPRNPRHESSDQSQQTPPCELLNGRCIQDSQLPPGMSRRS